MPEALREPEEGKVASSRSQRLRASAGESARAQWRSEDASSSKGRDYGKLSHASRAGAGVTFFW